MLFCLRVISCFGCTRALEVVSRGAMRTFLAAPLTFDLLLRLLEFDLVCRRVTCMQTFSLGHVEEVQSRCADRGGYRLLPPIPPFQHYPLFQDFIVLPLFPFRDWEDLAYIEPRGESSPLVRNNSVLLLLRDSQDLFPAILKLPSYYSSLRFLSSPRIPP